MKKFFVLNTFILCACTVLLSVAACGQNPPASPADSVSGKVGAANVAIKYSSPSVKGRKVWGELVPYGKVWRAGANNATTFTTDKNITVEGKALPAGRYALFTIPTEKEWTIVFNKTADQWGAFKYDEKQDVLRVTATPRKSASMNERLSYALNNNGFVLRWENMEVPVSVK